MFVSCLKLDTTYKEYKLCYIKYEKKRRKLSFSLKNRLHQEFSINFVEKHIKEFLIMAFRQIEKPDIKIE